MKIKPNDIFSKWAEIPGWKKRAGKLYPLWKRKIRRENDGRVSFAGRPVLMREWELYAFAILRKPAGIYCTVVSTLRVEKIPGISNWKICRKMIWKILRGEEN